MTLGASKSAVYFALTVDYGNRDPNTQADNMLDFDGFLHVDDVPAFVRAPEAWRADVFRNNGRREGRRETREAVLAAVHGATAHGATA